MAYSAEISRVSPTAFLFLLDQSASMQDRFGGAKQRGDAAPSKARVLADTVNRLLQNLVLRCAKEDGVRDYFHVGVIGYGPRVQHLIEPAEGHGAPGGLVPISGLAERPLRLDTRTRRVPDGDGGFREQTTRVPVWFEPRAENGTPMCAGLDLAAQAVRDWTEAFPDAFPPTVLNVTDGEATDGEPLRYAQTLRSMGTRDGEALLFNVHLSETDAAPVTFPDAPDELPREDPYAQTLFQMSSALPFSMRAAAENEGFRVSLDTRGFVYNADPAALVQLLEIGTRPSNLR
jgi:hypothetical protein